MQKASAAGAAMGWRNCALRTAQVLALGLAFASASVLAANAQTSCATLPHTFSANTPAHAQDVNDNFNCTVLKGNPTVANITASGSGSATGVFNFYRLSLGAPPANSGAADSAQIGWLGSGNSALRFGVNSDGTPWLQSSGASNYANFLGLVLNPNGGPVAIGKLAAASTLDVNGEVTTNGGIRMTTTPGGPMKSHLFQQGNDYMVFENTNASGGAAGIFYMQSDVDNAPIIFVAPIAGASDERLKKNIQPLTGALATIMQMRPVTYDWRTVDERTVGKSIALPQGARQVGFVAQELAQVYPQAVFAPAKADDVYTVSQERIIPLLVQAIKEQQAEIDGLKAKLGAQ